MLSVYSGQRPLLDTCFENIFSVVYLLDKWCLLMSLSCNFGEV